MAGPGRKVKLGKQHIRELSATWREVGQQQAFDQRRARKAGVWHTMQSNAVHAITAPHQSGIRIFLQELDRLHEEAAQQEQDEQSERAINEIVHRQHLAQMLDSSHQ